MERQQAQPVAIAPGNSPAGPADPHGIQPLSLRTLTALDQFPAKPLAALQLFPARRLKKSQGFENSPGFCLVEVEQIR